MSFILQRPLMLGLIALTFLVAIISPQSLGHVSADINSVRINEVESNGGTPGDWVEFINVGATTVDLTGYFFRDNVDNDPTHNYSLPASSTIAAGGYLVLDEAQFGFGLGSADSTRLFAPDGTTLIVSYSWTSHAATTYGRCPNGTGELVTTTASTKGAANNCGAAASTIKINEIESSGGSPGDWAELYNAGASPVDISGFIFKDNDDGHSYTIGATPPIAAGAYFVLDEAVFGFGLGNVDSARLFNGQGALVDSYAWLEHSSTTYGRCPNGTGAFGSTLASTKGTANACPVYLAWPGDATVQTVDGTSVFGGNSSGLIYEGSGSATPGVLWAVRNGLGTLFRLVWNGTIWTPDPANGWAGTGKFLRYPNGTGDVDAEGVTFAGPVSSAGIYAATERDNSANSISRPAILRFDPNAAGPALTATNEWNLKNDLPALGANLGLEGITWIPDAFLVPRGFFDESKGHAYQPSEYANHGTGLFFVGVEADGFIYGYALDHGGGGFTRVATIDSGFPGVMEVQFDRDTNDLWAVCDDTCLGRTAVLRIDPGTGKFVIAQRFERPAGMPNINNEGFAMASQKECVNNRKPAFWADDSETGGHSIRRGTVSCNDADGDAILDDLDNCDFAVNPGQQDRDRDGKGDACDADGLIPAACEGMLVGSVIIGTSGNDNLIGSVFNDLILAQGGNDTVDGNGGDDCIDGGPGNDTLTGRDGNDVILGGEGNNAINAGNGKNTVRSGNGNDRIQTGNGADKVDDSGGNNTVESGGGGDTINTGAGNDVICTGIFATWGDVASCTGGAGRDVVNAGEGNNKVQAGNGGVQGTPQIVTAGNGNDDIRTGDGVDQINAGGGNNTVDAGAGNDSITAGSGVNTINCGPGTDVATLGSGANTNVGGACETF